MTLTDQAQRAARRVAGANNNPCPYCGSLHAGQLCPRITAIHLYPNGRLKGLTLETLEVLETGGLPSNSEAAWEWEATPTR